MGNRLVVFRNVILVVIRIEDSMRRLEVTTGNDVLHVTEVVIQRHEVTVLEGINQKNEIHVVLKIHFRKVLEVENIVLFVAIVLVTRHFMRANKHCIIEYKTKL